MRSLSRIAVIVLVVSSACAMAAPTPAADGLVAHAAREFDRVRILPGADFRSYRRIVLAKVDVALRQDWLRDMNRDRSSLWARVSEADARRIIEDARASFEEAWEEVFRAAGYEIVSTAGEGVLQVRPSIVDLALNAPAGGAAGIVRRYAREAGEATLDLELRDSRSGALLARLTDRRVTVRREQPQLMLDVTNRREFSQLFATWARGAAAELEELAARSPLPARAAPRARATPG